MYNNFKFYLYFSGVFPFSATLYILSTHILEASYSTMLTLNTSHCADSD